MIIPEEQVAPLVDEIKRVLGDSVEVNEIEREVKLFLDYGVSVQEAKRGVLKKLGNRQSSLLSSTGIDKDLKDIDETDKNLNIKVKIISVDTKTVQVDNEDKTIFYGILADESASVPFTSWNDYGLTKNMVITASGAYVKGFRGELQINFGNNTTVEKLHSEELSGLTPEMLEEFTKPQERKIKELKSGVSNIVVTGRILNIESREVVARGEQKTVFSGALGDETGKIQFSAWNDFNLKKGDVIKISKCYIKNWRGIPQISFDENSQLEFLEHDALPPADILQDGKVRRLIELEDTGGAFDITIEGVVMGIRSGSGIITRCSQCRRVLQDNNCMVHGPQQGGEIDMRVKAILDDGTGSLMAVLSGELTSKIIDISSEEYREKATDSEYLDTIINCIDSKLLFERFKLRGNITKDNFGFMMIVQDITPLEVNVPDSAVALLETLEEY